MDTRGQFGWTQQGPKLVGDPNSAFGESVALSADGNIALVGEPRFNSNAGAVVVFSRSDCFVAYRALAAVSRSSAYACTAFITCATRSAPILPRNSS
jgi:hypothetical protein